MPDNLLGGSYMPNRGRKYVCRSQLCMLKCYCCIRLCKRCVAGWGRDQLCILISVCYFISQSARIIERGLWNGIQ